MGFSGKNGIFSKKNCFLSQIWNLKKYFDAKLDTKF